GLTLGAVVVADRPADRGHAFGHGKAENLAALGQTVFLLLTSFWIVSEGVSRLLGESSQVSPSIWAILVMLLSILVDFGRARHLKRVAREEHSQALEADALHFSTDLLSSLVVLLGVFLAYLGSLLPVSEGARTLLAKFDILAAFFTALLIVLTSFRMLFKSVNALMDATPQGVAETLESAVKSVSGVLEVAHLRVRESGSRTFVDLTIEVCASLSITEAHEVANQVERAVHIVLKQADVTVHVEPLSAKKTSA
ncbi:MAG: cation transporter, partial [Desulfovibrio sp.]|nr:cation transporter [Desulfovibrio sp.]